MKYCIGIDGGGTKTAAAISDSKSNILKTITFDTTSYREIGIDEACKRIRNAIDDLLSYVGGSIYDVHTAAIGISAYGEDKTADSILFSKLTQMLSPILIELVNDVVVGFWGALGGEPGINIVAGTGSIAYGEDDMRHSMRCGGWSEQFGDEGSCYWAGKRAMELFTHESDGRAVRAALYDIVKEKYQLKDDFDFIKLMEQDVLPYRKATAAFQMVLLEAAKQGDNAAIKIYRDAAVELFKLANAIKEKLKFNSNCKISLTGGMRHAGSLVIEPLMQLLAKEGMQLCEPKGTPVMGAILFAECLARKR